MSEEISREEKLACTLQWVRLDLSHNGEILGTDDKRIEFIDSTLNELGIEVDIASDFPG